MKKAVSGADRQRKKRKTSENGNAKGTVFQRFENDVLKQFALHECTFPVSVKENATLPKKSEFQSLLAIPVSKLPQIIHEMTKQLGDRVWKEMITSGQGRIKPQR